MRSFDTKASTGYQIFFANYFVHGAYTVTVHEHQFCHPKRKKKLEKKEKGKKRNAKDGEKNGIYKMNKTSSIATS